MRGNRGNLGDVDGRGNLTLEVLPSRDSERMET